MNRFRPGTICALAVMVMLFAAGHAHAWSDGGHRIIANITFNLLDAETRAKAVQILRAHPRFKFDWTYKMPDSIAADSKSLQERWIFLQAAVWPDIARGLRDYHIGPWHYINVPMFLGEIDKEALKKVEGIFPNMELPANVVGDPKNLNAVQAIKHVIRRLQDPNTTTVKKAVYLCWLMHIVGDVHQPMHSTSLYSRGRFNTIGGDRGGNGIRVKQSENLHAFWDGLLGRRITLNDVQKRTFEIASDAECKKKGDAAAKSLKADDWIAESRKLCKDVVYIKIILDEVASKEADPTVKLARVDLPLEYRKNAGRIAQLRAAEAGYRLCEIIKQCVK